jgi:hypothetical protein
MSQFPLSYCPHASQVLERLQQLYDHRDPEQICAVLEVPSGTLTEFSRTHTDGYCGCPETSDRIRFWDAYLRERTSLQDDAIPSAYLSEMDQGLYGGLIGGDVRFLCDPVSGWISSMVPPILSDWGGLESLSFARSHPWFVRYQTYLDEFAAAAEGKFGISHFILISGLNFVFELVGATHTYFALTDYPDKVRRAVELGLEINTAVQQAFFERVPLLAGGTCSNMVQWIPGRIVSESVDPFHMTSLACFEQWGLANLEAIFARFDGGVLHLHANGRHLLEGVAAVRGLRAVYLADDRGFPPAFDFLAEARARLGDLPLVVSVPYDVFRKGLERSELMGGVLYRVSRVPDLETANRLMDTVRAYRGRRSPFHSV